MRTRRTIVIVAAAVALPLTGVAVFGTPSVSAGAATPTFPVSCKFDATVAFSPPLTNTGTHTSDKAAVTTMTITLGHLGTCETGAPTGAPTKGTVATIIVKIKATNLRPFGLAHTYATGYCPSFMSNTTLKSLRGVVFDITWTKGETGTSLFTTKKAATATDIPDSELGFTFSGKEVLGSYVEKGVNQITAFFDATTSAALKADCSGGPVSSGTIDNSNSVAML